MTLPPPPPHPRAPRAEFGLPLPGRMPQGDEHLPPPQPPLPHVGLHDRLPAGEAVLGPQPLEDAPRRVPLLAGPTAILLQDPVNDARERVELVAHRRLAAPVARPQRHAA